MPQVWCRASLRSPDLVATKEPATSCEFLIGFSSSSGERRCRGPVSRSWWETGLPNVAAVLRRGSELSEGLGPGVLLRQSLAQQLASY